MIISSKITLFFSRLSGMNTVARCKRGAKSFREGGGCWREIKEVHEGLIVLKGEDRISSLQGGES
jgi:hypothetical protein